MSANIYLEGRAKLFSASVKLQTVATSFKKIIGNIDLTPSEKKAITWARDLFGKMDWNSEHYKKQENPGLTILATQLRPGFYHKLFKLGVAFDEDYSNRAYQTLQTFGKKGLDTKEIPKFQELFQQMSNSILSYLQRNSGYR